MKTAILHALAVAIGLSASSLLAQDDGRTAGQVANNYEIKLSAEDEVAFIGRDVRLRLKIEVLKDCHLPATLLSGYEVETEIDGKRGPSLHKKVAGRIAVAANTQINRVITLPSNRVMGGTGGSELHRVSFVWTGLIGVSATVSMAPDMSKIDISKLALDKTQVTLDTNVGKLKLKFYPDKAPNHVKNFLKLVKEGFYDGTRFHRVVRNFMIQGGCPYSKKGATGTPGTGDPGYKVNAEFNDTRHVRGILSMARSNDPNSAGCQFFIMHANNPGLDGKYSAFGELVTGHDTLDRIAMMPVESDGQTPTENIWIKAAIMHPVFLEK